MIKKIFTGALLAIVFGLLILGAVNRTLAKSNKDSPYALNTNLAIDQGKGSSHGSSSFSKEEQQEWIGNETNGVRQEQNNFERSENDGFGDGLASVEKWVTRTGQVASITDELWVIELSDGNLLEFEGRMLSYLIQQGFSANIGDTLTMTTFFNNDHYEVGQIHMTISGEEFFVRDENGRPLWAGNGRSSTGN
jgi:hypothetical protein